VNDIDRRYSSGASDDDAIFADIVAHLNDETAEPERPPRPPAKDATTDTGMSDRATESARGAEQTTEPATEQTIEPASEQTTEPATEQTTEPATERTEPARRPGELPAGDRPPEDPDQWAATQPPERPGSDEAPAVAAPQGWRVHEVDDEAEEHFEPPPSAPLPVGDLQFWAIIAGMVGGPLLLLYIVFFNRDASSAWVFVAIGLSLGGFVLLVSRMPSQHEDDDDGARL